MELRDLLFITSLSIAFFILGIENIFWPHHQLKLNIWVQRKIHGAKWEPDPLTHNIAAVKKNGIFLAILGFLGLTIALFLIFKK